MTKPGFDKERWVELFEEIGLDQATMQRWHGAFETRYPAAHQSFLEWLAVPAEDIERIREASRERWA
jgi:hypothetical protein